MVSLAARTLLGLVFLAFGLGCAGLTARQVPHSDKELFMWVLLAVLGAFIMEPENMVAGCKNALNALLPLLPHRSDP